MADSPSTVLGPHWFVSQVSDNDGGRRGSAVTFESRMNFTLKSFFSFSSIISQGAGGRHRGDLLLIMDQTNDVTENMKLMFLSFL